MESSLATLRLHLDVLYNPDSTGKKPRVGKTERAKAVAAIKDALSRKTTQSALTAASLLEMVKGPEKEPSVSGPPLGWCELAAVLIESLDQACTEAVASKSASKSGKASMKPEYMGCFRTMVKLALSLGPSGVIRPVVPPFLFFAHQWLTEPVLRALMADQIWQCVRDILADDANRAMLTPPYIRTWVDVCVEQLTGRGPLKHPSNVVSSLAGEVLEILARGVDNYDVLSQSIKSLPPSKMLGGDFGYAIICERCCLMLVVAQKLPHRDAREIQRVAFQTLTTALSDHALDMVGGNALQSIINACIKPIASCWTDKRHHDIAVSMARILLLLAPTHKQLVDTCRGKLLADMRSGFSSAVIRSGLGVRDEFIDAAALCVSIRECLEFASAPDTGHGHVIVWLRIAHAILSRRVLKKDIAFLVDSSDLLDQCTAAAETIYNIFRRHDRIHDNSYIGIVQCSTQVIEDAGVIGNSIHNSVKKLSPSAIETWQKLYLMLREMLTKLKYPARGRGSTMKVKGRELQPFDMLLRTISLLCSLDIIEKRTIDSCFSIEHQREIPYPLSRITATNTLPSALEVEYFRNLISRSGVPNVDGGHLLFRLVDSLVDLCECPNVSGLSTSQLLIDASCSLLALTRGECSPSTRAHMLLIEGGSSSSKTYSLQAFDVFQLYFGYSASEDRITENGEFVADKIKEQDQVWLSHNGSRAFHWLYGVTSGTDLLFQKSLRDGTSPISKTYQHFDIDSYLSESLEDQVELKLMQIVEKSSIQLSMRRKQNSSVRHEVESQFSVEPCNNAGFENEAARVTGSKVLLFVGNFLVEGLSRGLLSLGTSGNGKDGNLCEKMMNLFAELLELFANTDVESLVILFSLTYQVVRLSSKFCDMLLTNRFLVKSKTREESFGYRTAQSLRRSLTDLSTGLCEYFMAMLTTRSKKNVKVIRLLSEDYLIENPSDPATSARRKRSRPRPRQPERRVKRKRLVVTSSEEDADSDEEQRQPNFKKGVFRDEIGPESASDGSESEDLGFIGASPFCRKSNNVGDRTSEQNCSLILRAAEMLVACIRELSTVRDSVLEVCLKGVHAMDNVERMLSPDGFERAALACPLLDPSYLELRKSLWAILFSLDTTAAFEIAGKDLVKMGTHWKGLESTTHSYAAFYMESLNTSRNVRKAFPMSQGLEQMRRAFLEYGQFFLKYHQTSNGSLSPSGEDSGPTSQRPATLSLITGMIDVSEHFRVSHAFRMPRLTRISYLKFGLAAVELLSSGSTDLIEQPDDMEQPSALQKAMKAIQSAICKFLADSEAIVRMFTAQAFPRFLVTLSYPLSRVEVLLQDSIPQGGTCRESSVFFGCRVRSQNDEGRADSAVDMQFSLDEEEQSAYAAIYNSFRFLGARAKSCAAFVALGEVAIAREDLLPFCVVQILFRVLKGAGNLAAAYQTLIRLGVSRRCNSPRRLYQSFERVLLSKWFNSPHGIERLYDFPVALVVDKEHHDDTLLYDWLREQQERLIPHILVRETRSDLKQTAKFADTLGYDLETLLTENVSSFSLVFPMQFMGGLHEKASRLWRAIEDVLGGQEKTKKLMFEKKSDVIGSFLQSACSGQSGLASGRTETPGDNMDPGFFRDTREVRPPLFDPLIVALAINQLFESETNSLIVPTDVLHGSLFAEVRDLQSGLAIADNFTGFIEECQRGTVQRGKVSLLRMLITISRAMIGPPYPMPSQNRIDGYFCVGMLWRMLGDNILVSSSSERVIFYKLIVEGFKRPETASDAAWLLLEVQKKAVDIHEKSDFSVSSADLCTDPAQRDYLLSMNTTQERQMYELLNTVSPTLIAIVSTAASVSLRQVHEIARGALMKLLQLCHEKGLWMAVLTNGPYPKLRPFLEVTKLYEYAKAAVEVHSGDEGAEPLLFSLTRFQGIYRSRNGVLAPAAMLACLQELRLLLTDSTAQHISRLMKREAWVRSDGQEGPTVPHIQRSIACLISLVYETCATIGNRIGKSDSRLPVPGQSSEQYEGDNDPMLLRVLHETGNVLGVLGLLLPQSNKFIRNDTHHKSIPALSEKNGYEGVDSGIQRAFFLLHKMLQGPSPIEADSALTTLLHLLRSDDGSAVYKKEKRSLEFITPFRSAARKLVLDEIPFQDLITCEPSTGEALEVSSLPGFLDAQLWSIERRSKKEKPYDQWMRRFCCVLAKTCTSNAMKSLASMCYISYKFSCEMLPYLLMDVVCELTSSDTIQEISILLRQHILNNCSVPIEILGAFVHALDVLCQIGMGILSTKGISPLVRRTPDKMIQLRSRYVLEVPYVEAASAALRSGSYFSVIRFAQMHIDQKITECELTASMLTSSARGRAHGSDRRHSSCPGRDQSLDIAENAAREDVKNLVREAMRQISELDGVRAFDYEESIPKSAAGLAALDKDWPKSFSALDIVARHTAEQSRCEGRKSQAVDLKREVSLMQSFIGLGTLSIATDYWNGLQRRVSKNGIMEHDLVTSGGPSAAEKLNDLRYAIAWKLGQWELPVTLQVQNPSRNTSATRDFHITVYRVLHAFRTDRYDEASMTCANARLRELQNLIGNSSGVPAKTLFQGSARLQVFNILEVARSELVSESLRLPSHLALSAGNRSSLQEEFWNKRSRNASEPGTLQHMLSQGGSVESPTACISDQILGQFFGVRDIEVKNGEVSPFHDAFDESILAEDLPIAIISCLNKNSEVARAAATVSFRLLSAGDSGSWTRSTSSLGTASTAFLLDANDINRVAWKLQEARLRWSANDDAPSRKQALCAVKDIISRDLQGNPPGRNTVRSSGTSCPSQALVWQNEDKDCEQYAFLRSEACRMAANWSLDMRTHEPMDLFETFLKSGLQAVQGSARTPRLAARAHFAMATFADAQITNIDAYRKTKKYERMVSAIWEAEESIEKLKTMKKERKLKPKGSSRKSSRSSRSELTSGAVTENQIGRDLELLIKTEQKKASQDRSRLEKLNKTYQKWQVLACRHFAGSLRDGTTHDLRAAFRMVALWLDSGEMRDEISMALVTENVKDFDFSTGHSINVPVAKLLSLAPQLSSRLSGSGTLASPVFHKTLASTVQHMAEKFPAHCLWQLLALSNSTRTSGTQERYSSLYRGDKDKKEAADEILGNLQRRHGETVREMKLVADAYIALSETPDNQKSAAYLEMKGTALVKLGSLTKVPVPTLPLPLNGLDAFSELPTITGFEKRAGVCSGLSKPLKVVCYGSDGKRYAQMVKGRDDLRGDAVMEQLFTILNSLLEKDIEASQRSLLVRTYRIIPLSPFSGIMQFVSNTQQFKDLLVEKGKQGTSQIVTRSLHERYRPNDMRHDVIQTKVFEYRAPHQLPKRLQIMRQVWQKFQPVFRFFFLEQWPDPAEWFSRQTAYSRSVAVMSIVGFILGLGDRHLSNLLMDVVSGEIVHIDFGIAFEQGKLLPTPELMPFRLTRDIVDGFGIAGVEGVFRKCSEVTLSVMRRNKDVLLTVVEVLLHDPMFNWALTPEEVIREQLGGGKGNDDIFESDELGRSLGDSAADEVVRKVNKNINGSAEAHRALNRISEKLDGLEGTERLSVGAHVARLLDEAQAFHVVASVYPGWAPWL